MDDTVAIGDLLAPKEALGVRDRGPSIILVANMGNFAIILGRLSRIAEASVVSSGVA